MQRMLKQKLRKGRKLWRKGRKLIFTYGS